MNQRVEPNRLEGEIESRLLSSGADFVGFADISGVRSSINLEQRTAVAIGIAYDSAVVDRLDSEIEAFERHLADTKDEMETVLLVCVQYLRQRDFKAWIHFSKDLPGLLSDFSHKMAATKAGLGWIGRSSLFVSTEFGCGVRLATVLTNASFTPGEPVSESRCGDCTECVKACPYGAIRGAYLEVGVQTSMWLVHKSMSGWKDGGLGTATAADSGGRRRWERNCC